MGQLHDHKYSLLAFAEAYEQTVLAETGSLMTFIDTKNPRGGEPLKGLES